MERVYAQCPAGWNSLCQINFESKPNFIGNIVNILIVIAIFLSMFFLIRGGIMWMTSGGDKGKLDQARNTVLGAVIGLIISFFAYFIVNLIVSTITGVGLNGFTLPRLTN